MQRPAWTQVGVRKTDSSSRCPRTYPGFGLELNESVQSLVLVATSNVDVEKLFAAQTSSVVLNSG